MMLSGKVQTARFTDFYDLEVTVVDKEVVKPMGGRPQYTCRLVKGLPEIEHLRVMRKKASQEELDEYMRQIPLPQEDQVLTLVVLDIGGKGAFTRLLCEVVV